MLKQTAGPLELYLGIDWGKKFSQLFAVDQHGVIVTQTKLETLDAHAWRTLLEALRAQYSIRAGFEVGAHYDWLYDLLMEFCVEVFVIDPAQFAVIAKSQRKTDKIDAQKIAEGVRRGDLPLVHVPDKQTRADRRLVAFSHWGSQLQASLKTKIRTLLLTHRLDCPFSDVTGVQARKWLAEVARLELDAQSQLFLDMLLEQLELLKKQRNKIAGLVEARAQSYTQAGILDSIPGLGKLGILAILSAVAGIKRFSRPAQLSSYFGVCGSVFQSGSTLIQGPLTKRGNVHVRWLLSQALQHLHRKDPRARKRFMKLRRRKPCGVARGAQVRWLTEIIWHVLTKNECYRIKETA